MKDQATLDFYAREAEAYAARYRVAEELTSFLALVPPVGRILELGCGDGQDSEAMLAAGFDVTPSDGSAELAREAERRLRRPVMVLLFEDIGFDGGALCASFKTGAPEGSDRFGRYYNNPTTHFCVARSEEAGRRSISSSDQPAVTATSRLNGFI